ncbi:two-component response regulator ARR14-like isoform X2 [Raphanus sativus]|uniref:Two-component response regulator ARR14-like isoform X2 n=1 Tax=Raphanus sativus TaxID=3726 RepID=A0A6J0N0Y6_RAPSA|nr:two-component response regulator ARR14-like isoform X2 [Raphanus sativus]
MVEKWGGDENGGPDRDLLNSPNMFSGNFPEGLRVLLFGEDRQYLHILEKHLQEFGYVVTTSHDEERAMYLLRNHWDKFDIAIMEAHTLEGKIFRLISENESEIDIPIIITSQDDSRESVTKWMRNGACDYLIKPIRPEDLRLIYKYLIKKMKLRSVTVAEEAEEKAAGEKSSFVGDSTIRSPNRRKRNMLQTEEEDPDHNRDSATKKRRVVWDDNLNGKFLEAVNYLSRNDVVPKKILERMNVSGLTRENVASHLQKFRMGLKKKNDQNKSDDRSLITPQERGMSSGERSNELYRGRNVQFPTHHVNNIPQPSYFQQHNTSLNLMTQRVSPPGNHYDRLSVASSSRNLVTTHQIHTSHQQISEFPCNDQNIEERLIFNEDEDDGVRNLITNWLTQNLEPINLFPLEESVIATTMRFNDIQVSGNQQQHVHAPSMVHIPLLPSSLSHNPFLDKKENIQLMDFNGQQLCPEQQQSNLANENRFPETNPRRGSPRRDKMGQDRDQA